MILPICRLGELDAAYDEEVVGEGSAGDGFAEAVVAGGEAELGEVAVDGGGVACGYGSQYGGEAKILGEGNGLPPSVRLALDGVLRAEVHVLLRGIDDDGSHDGGCRQFLVLHDQPQRVGVGHCFGAVRLLSRFCLLCRLMARCQRDDSGEQCGDDGFLVHCSIVV